MSAVLKPTRKRSPHGPHIAIDREAGMSWNKLAAKYGRCTAVIRKHADTYAGLCARDVSGQPCIMCAGHVGDCRSL